MATKEKHDPTSAAMRAAEAITNKWSVGEGMRFCDGPVEFYDADDEEIARVIDEQTALPELLAACKAVTDMYCAFIDSGDAGRWNPEEVLEIKQARAAISKATGGEP